MGEIDAEQLVKNIETYGSAQGPEDSSPVPQKAEADDLKAPGSVEAQQTPQHPWSGWKSPEDLLKHKLEYTANGKAVNEDIATILKRASQGYHYAQRMNELNSKESEWAEKLRAAEESAARWSKFDEYARQNPAWYEHWQRAYENRSQNMTEASSSDANIEQRVNALLEQRLEPFKKMLDEAEQRKLQEQVQSEDRQLEETVKSIRAKYSDIDFDATDPESGKSLEYKILEYGVQNGIKSFETAFKAFYHDNLVKREIERAKEGWSKEKQTQTKAGIIDQKSTPSKSPKTPDVRGMSYDQITDLAAKSLGFN